MSKVGQTSLINIVAAGSKNPQTGRVNGGVYFPSFQKPGGQIVQARWEGNFFINSFGFKRDAQGNTQLDPATQQAIPRDNKVIRLTAWNGRNAEPGKGLADLMAKCISVGKQFSASANINIYEANVRDRQTGAVLQYTDGSPITTPRIGFTIVGGSFEFGNDSNKTVITEIQTWDPTNPNMDIYFRRPPQFNVPNTPDSQAWEALRALRQNQTYIAGNGEYGFARVASVNMNAQAPAAGMTAAVQNAVTQPIVQQPLNTVTQPAMAAPVYVQPSAVPAQSVPGMVVPQQF